MESKSTQVPTATSWMAQTSVPCEPFPCAHMWYQNFISGVVKALRSILGEVKVAEGVPEEKLASVYT